MDWMSLIGLFIMMAGFVIGLGAVTVIDLHGFLGRKSHYWTEATTRTHKVTKPLIWMGIILALVGGVFFYSSHGWAWEAAAQALIADALIMNGVFLSFSVSPFLLKREREGHAADLLPDALQKKIAIAFVVSFTGWWSALFLLAWYIVDNME